jgi:hypothetical protein
MNIDRGVKKHRSPAYPFVSLPAAVERAKVLYHAIKKNSVSIDTVQENLGFDKGSSQGSRIIAALKSYGLLDDEDGAGQYRKLRLTSDGLRLFLLDEGDRDRAALIRSCAVRPKIYSDIIERWPEDLPPDSEIRKFLTVDRDFNPDSVDVLIRNFRATYDYAGLCEVEPESSVRKERDDIREDTTPGGSRPLAVSGDHTGIHSDRSISTSSATREVRDHDRPPMLLPLSPDKLVYMYIPANMTDDDFDYMIEMLNMMRRGIVASPQRVPPNQAIGATEGAE